VGKLQAKMIAIVETRSVAIAANPQVTLVPRPQPMASGYQDSRATHATGFW